MEAACSLVAHTPAPPRRGSRLPLVFSIDLQPSNVLVPRIGASKVREAGSANPPSWKLRARSWTRYRPEPEHQTRSTAACLGNGLKLRKSVFVLPFKGRRKHRTGGNRGRRPCSPTPKITHPWLMRARSMPITQPTVDGKSSKDNDSVSTEMTASSQREVDVEDGRPRRGGSSSHAPYAGGSGRQGGASGSSSSASYAGGGRRHGEASGSSSYAPYAAGGRQGSSSYAGSARHAGPSGSSSSASYAGSGELGRSSGPSSAASYAGGGRQGGLSGSSSTARYAGSGRQGGESASSSSSASHAGGGRRGGAPGSSSPGPFAGSGRQGGGSGSSSTGPFAGSGRQGAASGSASSAPFPGGGTFSTKPAYEGTLEENPYKDARFVGSNQRSTSLISRFF